MSIERIENSIRENGVVKTKTQEGTLSYTWNFKTGNTSFNIQLSKLSSLFTISLGTKTVGEFSKSGKFSTGAPDAKDIVNMLGDELQV